MKQTLKKDLIQAMKEKDALKKGVLQLLIAGIKNEEIKVQHELNTEEQVVIVKRELKQTKDSLESAIKASREDLIKENKEKVELLEKYLPKMLSEQEILEILKSKGAEKGMKMGQLMGMIMKEHKSEVDGSVVNKVIKDNFL